MSTCENKCVLVVEDDPDIADMLAIHLLDEGFRVEHVADGDIASERLMRGGFDMLLLDIMLPGASGLDLCRQARRHTAYIPIIIISARGAESQRILGLELGADDYISKPFSALELVARMRALFRREAAFGREARRAAGAVEQNGLYLDPVTRVVQLDGKPVALTAREFDLLLYFAQHPGQVFSRIDLLAKVWGYSHAGYEHTVNTHINRLRCKIEPDPAQPTRILTVWGVGYKFVGGETT
ncbi:MAG: response regulator transcription factor [Gammaproteobacteria bacterium]|jgi:DNA-binding response OmpR family regulator|nr:response regulator transcription factor [Gammaproteobacteria bacterium]MBU1407814.1 response regulator transcription factor [Gammaproteobacteria bacterium]MBU1531927.1 response regulator transcription factor [Gammaproteobacteria bacterium]